LRAKANAFSAGISRIFLTGLPRRPKNSTCRVPASRQTSEEQQGLIDGKRIGRIGTFIGGNAMAKENPDRLPRQLEQ
jgi:hypothetical protein